MAFEGDAVNRKKLILGISISTLLLLAVMSGVIWLRKPSSEEARVDRRYPLQRLGYCDSSQETPCIVSFSLASNEKMIVSFLTTGAFYPDFYLKIKQGEETHIYNCEKTSKFATNVYCSGEVMPLGQALQFSIFSVKEEVLLAEGDLSIIGMALGTPVVFLVTPSEEVTLPPIAVAPAPLVTFTPRPSYPNPSYPNPSPSYP